MTKDVLVSISGKHIDIMDDPARGYEVGEDGIEVVTPANYYCRNGKHYILYDELRPRISVQRTSRMGIHRLHRRKGRTPQ